MRVAKELEEQVDNSRLDFEDKNHALVSTANPVRLERMVASHFLRCIDGIEMVALRAPAGRIAKPPLLA
ncbi:hypothetical protein [Rhizobium viscosum]|uniref:Uncharacterized protein n=1 Tax=Rhizobium viscosum TaxID=1673 RepID=A0ABR9IZU0_RHIVS|nr:hypothetical protein [Rhizobium viscosum]MBE1508744.1 hypothetical protein [Rhizobium viscosum]